MERLRVKFSGKVDNFFTRYRMARPLQHITFINVLNVEWIHDAPIERPLYRVTKSHCNSVRTTDCCAKWSSPSIIDSRDTPVGTSAPAVSSRSTQLDATDSARPKGVARCGQIIGPVRISSPAPRSRTRPLRQNTNPCGQASHPERSCLHTSDYNRVASREIQPI